MTSPICPVCGGDVTARRYIPNIQSGRYEIYVHSGYAIGVCGVSKNHYVLFNERGQIVYYKNYASFKNMWDSEGFGIQLGLMCI